MSNTSIGRGEKGSKFWMQTLVLMCEEYLLNEIKCQLPQINTIIWQSPIAKNNYKELKTKDIIGIKGANLEFWTDNGPWWDAVGITNDDSIILVEAKAHIQETKSKCKAKSVKNEMLIKESLEATHRSLAIDGHKYDESLWYSKYYQLANRLTFFKNLKDQKFDVKLILLNIVDDPTYIKTSEDKWKKHYEEVFQEMLGSSILPDDVILLNIKV